MDQLPAIDFATARRIGSAVVPTGPAMSDAEAAAVVEGLRRAAEASVAPVAEVTGLPAADDTAMPVVDRATWLRLNVEMAEHLLGVAAGGLRRPAGGRERLEARANGAQIGGALGLISGRVLGQYLPFHPVPRLVLVAPNVAKIEAELDVVPADFRLWVCLHEQTHRLQFARAPWLREFLLRQVETLLQDEGDAAPRPRIPRSLLDAVTSPAQRVVFDRVNAVMSLMEGYADVMMDRVGPDVVPTVAVIRQRFDARRARRGWSRIVNAAVGMEMKLAQYRDGAAFCEAVIDRVGVEGLNAVYESSGLLPSLAEIHDPQAWLSRVHPASATR